MKKNAGTYRRCVFCFALICAAALLIYGYYLYRENAAVQAEVAGRTEAAEEETEDPQAGEQNLFAQKEITYEGKTYRRDSYMKAVLCLGVDRRGTLEKTTTGFGGQADGIFLAARDTARNSLKLLMIPRDTMTNISLTDLSGNVLGKDVQHLALAYAYGDGREKSCEYMTEAVSELLEGLEIDFYLAVDIDAVSVINDAVGGVTVTVPTEGMETSDPSFIKGETVTLNGKQAEAFVRYRDTEKSHSALYRMDQQQEYIDQFFRTAKEKSQENRNIVQELFEGIQDYMITDMSKDQYLKMGMDALGTESFGAKDIYTLPGQGVATAKYDEFYPDREGLRKVVLDLFYREID